MRLGLATETCEHIGHRARLVLSHQHAHGGLAVGQLRREPVAIPGVEAETLVMERTHDRTTDDPGDQRGRRNGGQDQADTGALANAPPTELLGLDLSLVVQDEDADRVELDVVVGLVPVLE